MVHVQVSSRAGGSDDSRASLSSVGSQQILRALLGAGDSLPPQRGQLALLAGRREGFGPGASGRSLGLQLGDLDTNGEEGEDCDESVWTVRRWRYSGSAH